VARHGIRSVIELGCGDGSQLALGNYETYVGLDVSPIAVRTCAEAFARDTSKSFFLYDPKCFVDNTEVFGADLALSLDVVFHLVEDDVYQLYMQHLFASARSFVIIYSSDFQDRGGSPPYTRHRNYTAWVTEHVSEWALCEHEPNPHAALTSSEFRAFRNTAPHHGPTGPAREVPAREQ
jgi:SAM-dependent methyltransferase